MYITLSVRNFISILILSIITSTSSYKCIITYFNIGILVEKLHNLLKAPQTAIAYLEQNDNGCPGCAFRSALQESLDHLQDHSDEFDQGDDERTQRYGAQMVED